MFCPECGAPNEEDSVYCGNCGAPMDPDAVPAVESDETPEAEPAEESDVETFEEAPEELAEEEDLPADELSLVPTPPEPPSPPPPPPPPPVVSYSTSVQTSGMAIASLVMGIAGWTLLPLLGSILALVFGYAARREIRQRPDELTGEGLAIAGLVLGWIMVGLSVVGLCLGVIALCLIPVMFTSTMGY
jgi:uncharacterized Zn finger protein (UPF0148 family)